MDSSDRRTCDSTSDVEEMAGWDAAHHAAAYAFEMLSSTNGTRTSCIGAVFKDDRMYPWYYDCAGVVYCTEFASIINDFELAAALILGFAQCGPEQLGYVPERVFVPPSLAPGEDHFPPQSLTGYRVKFPDDGVEMTLRDPLFSAHALVGRRTFVYTAESNTVVSSFPRKVVVKFSYQPSGESGHREQDLVRVARDNHVGHLPKLHASADLWTLSDGVRDAFYTLSGGAAEYEDRTLRAIVYDRYASVRGLFGRRPELIPVMVDQMIDCKCSMRISLKTFVLTRRTSRLTRSPIRGAHFASRRQRQQHHVRDARRTLLLHPH